MAVDFKLLASVPMFSSLNEEELKNFASLWRVRRYKKNEFIFKKDDTAQAIYLIQSGSVSILLTALHHQEILLSILEKGNFFGELTLFDNVPRTATAKAVTSCTLLELPRSSFITFLKTHTDVAIEMLSELGKRLRHANDLVEQQATRNVNEEMEEELTFGERIADKVSEFVGSWTFIILFGFMLIGWMILNIYAFLFKPVDPYPFILLNLVLSCIAAAQAPIIMMSQGRQAKKDRLAAEMDYNINLKAELQIQKIQAKIDKILIQDIQRFNELKQVQSEILEKLNVEK